MKKEFITFFLRFFDFFIKKRKNYFFFIPHSNSIVDKIDFINFSSDNTLAFLHYLIVNSKFSSNNFFILIYHWDRLIVYENYIKRNNINSNITFVRGDFEYSFSKTNLLKVIKAFYFYSKCKFIFTSAPYKLRFPVKSKKQILFSLNYYTPFKKDIYNKGFLLKNIDYVFSTSDMASKVISISTEISFYNFINLGFPRNDFLLKPRFSRKNIYDFLRHQLKVRFFFDKIILYAPTHRDYDYANKNNSRPILGYPDIQEGLQKILESRKTLLIVKLHPAQKKDAVIKQLPRWSLVLEPNFEYSLYDILPYTDLLLTDYSSVYFDFLLLDKPIIFNFYDYELYQKYRGFSYEPIQEFCAGEIAYTKEELLSSIEKTLSNVNDPFREKRKRINRIMNKYADDKSAERVYKFIAKIIYQ